ncbi:SGS domain-containing protein [Podospora didyma]|uniref:SGS domain-containing protein n=1 Tax=Podospora didyma TaxID=330526 RepID=A0AAE0KIY8_9PEZI|nr:SGS domain-containing protein [Podospora didyma]
MSSAGQKGLEANRSRDYAAAIPLFDKALEDSNSPTWLLGRAQAHQQLKNYDDALRDAELAYHAAAERGSGSSRKQMIEAQYRRATILFKLGRYADSDCCAKWSMLLAEGRPAREEDGVEKNVDGNGNYTVTVEQGIADKEDQPGQNKGSPMDAATALTPKTGYESDWNRAYAWRSQALGFLKNVPADHPGRKVTVQKIPVQPTKKAAAKAPVKETVVADSDSSDNEAVVPKPNEKPAPAPGSVPEDKMKLRVDYYQSNKTVTVSLFVKDLKKDDLQVKFTKNQVRISPIPREAAPYVKPGDREATSTLVLGGEIVPVNSRWSSTPRKLELVLEKASPVKWGTWGVEKIGPLASDSAEAPVASKPVEAPTGVSASENIPAATTKPPAYPTSSKSGPKDWEKLGEGEGDDNEAGQDVNYFFKELYKNSSPEQQRAMMKSFVESNGTALSTDWNDVKNRTVETVPPEGIEAKKWDS